MKGPILGLGALLVLGLLAAGVFAFGGFDRMGFGQNGFGKDGAVGAAIDAGDYSAYQTAIKANGDNVKVLTQDQFNQLVAKHKDMKSASDAADTALQDGDYNRYVSAMESAWRARLPTQDQFNTMSEKYKTMQETKTKVDAAITAGDYSAWKTAVEGTPQGSRLVSVITQDNFATYVQLYKARESGDMTTVKTLSEQLGLYGHGFGNGGGFGRGMGRGMGHSIGHGMKFCQSE